MENMNRSFVLIIFIFFFSCTSKPAEQTEKAAQNENIYLIAPDAQYSTAFSYYNTTPESPDGQHIAYVQFTQPANDEGKNATAELWVCKHDLSERKKVTKISNIAYHNGARAQWVDNQRIAYMDGNEVFVVDVNSGNKVFGPIKGLLGHDAHNGQILIALNEKDGEWERGIYAIDVNTNKRTLIVRPEDFREFRDVMPKHDSVNYWRILHAQWSPDGSKVAMRLDVLRNPTEAEK